MEAGVLPEFSKTSPPAEKGFLICPRITFATICI